jgi:hypothetical protein
MRDRSEQVLKIVCLALVILLLVQLVKAALHANPLAGVVIPELPSLPAETNVIASIANKPATKIATDVKNSPSVPKTNSTLVSTDTNTVPPAKSKDSGSNSTPMQMAPSSTTNLAGTNSIAVISANTNATTTKIEKSTNAVAISAAGTNGIAAAKKHPRKPGDMAPELPPGMIAGFPGAGPKPAKLPPEIQARVDRVTDSEILGPINHPMPMALLGIAGDVAFLRSPSGQTGLIKEGEDLGEIKLLRIGTNRVLIEQNGEKKELMIFAGLGGESLLPKPTESSNETTNRN